jgi:hypothetical protein
MVFLLNLWWIAPPSYALYEVDLSAMSADLVQSSNEFFAEATALLPTAMKEAIGPHLKVKFADFSPEGSFEAGSMLPLPNCGQGDEYADQGSHIYAAYNLVSGEILLNKRFLYDILLKDDPERTFSCGHKSMYRLALAAIIHETAHRYDALNLRDARQKAEYESFGSGWATYGWSLYNDFLRETTVSTRESFKKLVHWNDSSFKSKSKNKNLAAVPDPYEVSSLAEEFAVNLEYFLLDPDYGKRRPSYHHYFSQLFALPVVDMQPNLRIPGLGPDGEAEAIDPARVYAVELLLAEAGRSLASRFGHLMLRLVVCAPSYHEADGTFVPAMPLGEECLKHHKHDIVINYAAELDGAHAELLKGLTGGYRSTVSISPYTKVRDEYVFNKNRNLSSFMVFLTREQISTVVHRAVEDYWSYAGKYRFFSNNCAVEARELLQAVIGEGAFLYSSGKTPYAVVESLVAAGLADAEPTVVDSRFALKLASRLALLQPDASEQDAMDFFHLSPQARQQSYHSWSKKSEDRSPLVRAQLYRDILGLESFIRQRIRVEYESKKPKILLEFIGNPAYAELPVLKQIHQLIAEANKNPVKTNDGYGIPLRLNEETSQQRAQAIEKLREKLDELKQLPMVVQAFAPMEKKLAEIERTIEDIKAKMVALLKV